LLLKALPASFPRLTSDGIRRGGLSFMNRIHALIKRPRKLLCSWHHVKMQQKTAIYEVGNRPSSDNLLASWSWTSPIYRTVRKKKSGLSINQSMIFCFAAWMDYVSITLCKQVNKKSSKSSNHISKAYLSFLTKFMLQFTSLNKLQNVTKGQQKKLLSEFRYYFLG
jgi:hypothetical protein